MRKRENRNIRITVDPRGKIKAGYKSNKGYPAKLDYFMLEHPETKEIIFPELIEAYGNKPQELIICFPSSNLEDVFNDDFNLWNKSNTKTRQCDGETCLHVLDEHIDGVKYAAGTTTECVCKHHELFTTDNKDLAKLKCKCDMYLKAYIINPKTDKVLNPLPYLFSCHSINSADNIFGMLSRIQDLKNIPFKISIKLVKKNNLSFPIWNIVPIIVTENLIEWKPELIAETSEQPEENYNEDTGEVYEDKNDSTLFNNEDYSHLQGQIARIKSCVTIDDVNKAFEVMIKGLKVDEVKYLTENVILQHKEFIRKANQ